MLFQKFYNSSSARVFSKVSTSRVSKHDSDNGTYQYMKRPWSDKKTFLKNFCWANIFQFWDQNWRDSDPGSWRAEANRKEQVRGPKIPKNQDFFSRSMKINNLATFVCSVDSRELGLSSCLLFVFVYMLRFDISFKQNQNKITLLHFC